MCRPSSTLRLAIVVAAVKRAKRVKRTYCVRLAEVKEAPALRNGRGSAWAIRVTAFAMRGLAIEIRVAVAWWGARGGHPLTFGRLARGTLGMAPNAALSRTEIAFSTFGGCECLQDPSNLPHSVRAESSCPWLRGSGQVSQEQLLHTAWQNVRFYNLIVWA